MKIIFYLLKPLIPKKTNFTESLLSDSFKKGEWQVSFYLEDP